MSLPGKNLGSADAGAFRTTHWTVILSAQEPGSPAAKHAIARLYEQYRYPLYLYIRRKGYNHHDAQDLTQDFFAQFIDRQSLEGVSPEKGRFRTFLLACVKNSLGTHRQKVSAAKRGGEYAFLSWDEDTADERYRLETCDHMSAERVFDRRWALTVLGVALKKLQIEYARAGKSNLFDALQRFLSGEKDASAYADVAAELNMTEPTLRVAVHRLRVRYGKYIRAEIANTVRNPEELAEELRYLRDVLSD
jgi:DNA-directed RNA polymerase specialized sigma24 family protein